MANLIDISFLIIAIAILGFIAKDSFYFYRRVNLPFELRDDNEKMFSNFTLGLLIICVCWIVIVTFIIPTPEFFKAILQPILENYIKMAQAGIISETLILETLKNIVIYGSLLSIASTLLLLIITISMVAGWISALLEKRAIKVTFLNSNDKPETFRRIIKESEDFFYFESSTNFRKWVAIPKSNVSNITNTITTEKSRFDKWLIDNFSGFLEKHPWIGIEKNRIKLVLFLMIGLLIITIIPRANEYIIIRILLVVILVPLIALLLIQNAFANNKDDE